MSELRGLGAVNEELEKRGGRLLAISTDSPAEASRVVAHNGLDFAILCDPEHVAIKAYGLLHPGGGPDGGDIAVPAQILIDRNGRIAWRFVSQRIQDRLDPRDVLRAVKRAAG